MLSSLPIGPGLYDAKCEIASIILKALRGLLKCKLSNKRMHSEKEWQQF
jgi:hypothetical protein